MAKAHPSAYAVTRQISAACIVPLLDENDETIGGTNDIESLGDPIPFDFIADAGPTFPDAAGSSDTSLIEVVAANGVTVQFPKETQVINGVTGGDGTASGGGGGSVADLHFTTLEWGKTMSTTLQALIGKLVIAVIPIGENVTSTEDGWYYILGRLKGFSYTKKGEEVLAVGLTITGTSATATGVDSTPGPATLGYAALAWAPPAINPIGDDPSVTPVALAGTDVEALLSGQIVTK